MAKERNWKKEYADFHGKPKEIAARASRNAARAQMVEKHGEGACKGKDVDHKKPLSEGGTNNPKNLRLEKPSVNRGRKTK